MLSQISKNPGGEPQTLALFLLSQRFNSSSPYYEYIQTLPECKNALLFSETELQLLKGSMALGASPAILHFSRTAWAWMVHPVLSYCSCSAKAPGHCCGDQPWAAQAVPAAAASADR